MLLFTCKKTKVLFLNSSNLSFTQMHIKFDMREQDKPLKLQNEIMDLETVLTQMRWLKMSHLILVYTVCPLVHNYFFFFFFFEILQM